MKCPHDNEEMELVDSHYNLELEEEYGFPVRIDTYICPKCHFENQIEEEASLKTEKIEPSSRS